MRFYSDELKQFFDTEEQCLAEEEKARIKAEEKKVTKAKLAKAVEDADKALDEAYEALNVAKDQVEELQKEFDSKVDAIMTPAYIKVKECIEARAQAIKEFNDKFGVYTTTYNGNQALNEVVKVNKILSNLFDRFYW